MDNKGGNKVVKTEKTLKKQVAFHEMIFFICKNGYILKRKMMMRPKKY